MPKTIIRTRTLMCPLGIGRRGEPDACRFHRATENVADITPPVEPGQPPASPLCPVHKVALVKASLPQDCITMTVMGEEEIEPEIGERTEPTYRTRCLAELDNNIMRLDKESERIRRKGFQGVGADGLPLSLAESALQVDREIELEDFMGKFASKSVQETLRSKGREHLERDIVQMKEEKETGPDAPTYRPAGHFLRTPAEIVDYRTRRKADIARAVVEARKYEDV